MKDKINCYKGEWQLTAILGDITQSQQIFTFSVIFFFFLLILNLKISVLIFKKENKQTKTQTEVVTHIQYTYEAEIHP